MLKVKGLKCCVTVWNACSFPSSTAKAQAASSVWIYSIHESHGHFEWRRLLWTSLDHPFHGSTWNSHQGCHASAGLRSIARVAKPSLEAIVGIETTTLGCSLLSSVICGAGSCHFFLLYFHFFSCSSFQLCTSVSFFYGSEVDEEKLPKEVWGIERRNMVDMNSLAKHTLTMKHHGRLEAC